MEIRTLGGFEVRIGGMAVHPGTPKQQIVMAMLAVHPGQLVTVDRLVDEVWPADPPRSGLLPTGRRRPRPPVVSGR